MNKILLFRTLRFLVLCLLALNASALSAPTASSFDWHLPKGARIEGTLLIAEIPAEDGPGNIWCAAKLDVGEALAVMKCVARALETLPSH